MAEQQDNQQLSKDYQELTKDIKSCLVLVDLKARSYHRIYTLLTICTIMLGTIATLLAGDSARNGKMFAGKTAEMTTGKAPSALPKGWRNVCLIIAVCTGVSTIAASIDKVLKIADHRTKAIACAGAFDSLRAELAKRFQKLDRLPTIFILHLPPQLY